jgi:chromate reductase, NAD(P)H dehydrogenase (quinone)
MMLLFVFSNWIFCGAAVAYGFRGEARCRAALGDKLPNTLNRTAPPGLIALAPHSLWPEIVEIGQLPTYNQDFDDNANPAPAWTAFRQQVKAYDAVLFVTPEYNYSVPGVLKNAIDWASRPYGDSAWNGKPAAIMGASTGTIGTARA